MKDENYEDSKDAAEKMIIKMEADDFEVHEVNPLEFDEGDSTLSWDKYKPSSSKDASRNSSTPFYPVKQCLKQRKRAAVLKYFERIGDSCRCNTCGASMKGDRIYNLKTHLERIHKIKLIGPYLQSIQKMRPPEVKKNIKIEIARNTFFKACFGLITDDELPLKVFNSANIKTILDPICDGLSGLHGKQVRLNTEYVCNTISLVANNIRDSIKSELTDRLLSLKVECATALSRTYITVSTQFVFDNKIESFVLGLIEMNKDEKLQSNVLTDGITNILKKFGVALDQIVSISSDNGADMIKANVPERKAEKTNKAYQQNMRAYTIFDEFFVILGVIRHCRFVAHTTQLCALDVSNDSDVKLNLMQCRNLTKFIQDSSNDLRGIFEAKQLKLPELDCVTRWGSTYSMICDLQNARDILSNVKSTVNQSNEENFNLNKNLLNFIDAYVQVFAPLQKILIKFQEELLNYGDFYASWLKCKLMTQRFLISDEKECLLKAKHVKILTNSLLLSLEAREQKFLVNDQMNACLYLDPRFHHLLNQERKLKASDFLLKLWEQLRRNNPKICDTEQKTNVSSDMKTIQSFSSDEDDENQILNNFLFNGICSRKIELNQDLKTKIQLFNPSFSGSNTNIFEFWKSKEQFDPELYALAQVCFGIPATQGAVEWTSSSMELIKSNLHNEITFSQLEDILLVKFNKLFLDEGFEALNLFEEAKKLPLSHT